MNDRDEDNLAELGAAIEGAEELGRRMDYLSVAKMPCPECGGSGSLEAGSLGSQCPGCFGARFVDQPFSEPAGGHRKQLEGIRKRFSDYCRALDDPELPAPSRAELPTVAEVAKVTADMAARCLGPTNPVLSGHCYGRALDVAVTPSLCSSCGSELYADSRECPTCGAAVNE